MGSRYEFACGKCGYRAEVAGGKDSGMIAAVQTMACGACHALVDVVIEQHHARNQDGDAGDDPLGVCPECGGTDVVVWGRGRPCPKCGGKMSKGALTELWD